MQMTQFVLNMVETRVDSAVPDPKYPMFLLNVSKTSSYDFYFGL